MYTPLRARVTTPKFPNNHRTPFSIVPSFANFQPIRGPFFDYFSFRIEQRSSHRMVASRTRSEKSVIIRREKTQLFEDEKKGTGRRFARLVANCLQLDVLHIAIFAI